jgi:hypothetical protein
MYKGRSNRVLPIILVLIVVAIAVAALVSVGRLIFNGGQSTDTTQVDRAREALLDTSTEHSVRMTVRGPIVANEDFRSYRITVTPTDRNLTTFSGYLEQTLDGKQLGNNTRAYEQFVYALDKANFMKGEAFSDDRDDTRGICATGRVYEFEVIEGGDAVKRLWTSTCKGSPGSFKASVQQVSNLFLQQIPDNKDLLNKIDL